MTDEKSSKLKFHCPNCGRSLYGATKEMIGDTGVCPKCKTEFVIGKTSCEESTKPQKYPHEDDQPEEKGNPKCSICGGSLALRAVEGSVSVQDNFFKKLILFRTTPVCICCKEAPCMVEVCRNRAVHVFQHDLLIENVTKYGVRVPNDVWVCDSHRSIVSRYRCVNYIARIFFYFASVITVILFFVALTSSRWSRLLYAVPVVAITIGAYVLAGNCAPTKKKEYSDKRHLKSDTNPRPLGLGLVEDSFAGSEVLSFLFGPPLSRTQGSV